MAVFALAPLHFVAESLVVTLAMSLPLHYRIGIWLEAEMEAEVEFAMASPCLEVVVVLDSVVAFLEAMKTVAFVYTGLQDYFRDHPDHFHPKLKNYD
jgi:hypothetical protein